MKMRVIYSGSVAFLMLLAGSAGSTAVDRRATHSGGAVSVVRAPVGKTEATTRTIPTTTTTRAQPAQQVPPKSSTSASSAGATAVYEIRWQSLNDGGLQSSSANYQANASVGQSAVGSVTSTNCAAGQGYWYGAVVGGGGCNCPNQGDINADAAIDVFDVIAVIGIAFSGDPDPQDPACPKTRGDANTDGATDVFDVIYLIATAFSGGPNPINPCGS